MRLNVEVRLAASVNIKESRYDEKLKENHL